METLPDGYTVKNGLLHLHQYDLAALARYWMDYAGYDDAPLTIRYLPSIRANFDRAQISFAKASQETGYSGEVRLAYASKANPNEAVIYSALRAGADYECSSRVDTWIIRYAVDRGWLKKDHLVLANGFKTSRYANELIKLVADGFPNITPIFDSAYEVPQFASSGIKMKVGLRYRVPGHKERFGMADEELYQAAQLVADAPTLTLTTFHAIQQYPALNNPEHMESLRKAFSVFLDVRSKYPSLKWFDIGGGLPAELTKPDDLQTYMVNVQRMIQECCAGTPLPGLILESGRYMAGSHELKVFSVSHVKMIGDIPYYIIGGSIMSSLPDAWALNLEFPVTALNYLDTPMHQVKLAGLTCDPDDVYPHIGEKLVPMPVCTDRLLVMFMDIGAYQDMLGGEGGAQHCLLSEGTTVLIGHEELGEIVYQPAQPSEAILKHLGYGRARHKGTK